ncbi:hypothetical protein CRYUN_Cryun01aG0237300 [Craigia yunnanensis]
MSGGGGDAPLPHPANGGEFILSLLQNPQPHHQQQKQPPLLSRVTPMTIPQPQPQPQAQAQPQPQPQPQQQQPLVIDPAVAVVGPTLSFTPSWQSNARDPPSPWPHTLSPSFAPNFLGFPQNPCSSPGNQFAGNQFAGNQGALIDDLRRLGFSGIDNNNNHVIQQKHQEQKLVFGSLPSDILLNGNLLENSKLNLSKQQFDSRLNSNQISGPYAFQHRNSGERGKQQQHGGNYRPTSSAETPRPPPGFSGKPRGGGGGGGSRDFGNRRHVEHNVDKLKAEYSQLSSDNDMGLRGQLDHPGPPAGSNLQSVSAIDIEGSLLELHRDGGRDGFSRRDGGEVDGVGKKLLDSLIIEDESDDKNDKKQHRREKESRIDNRGQRLLSRRVRMLKRQMECSSDVYRLNAPLLAIYESLIPPEEERAKQKQLLALLEKLVCKEWPEARLYLYGSCANTFGVSKSDIDVCIAFNEDINKSEILLKLADILQSDNLQNVQGMETTYTVTVDDVECAYFDQVEKLRNFGSCNKETVAQLVWAFFKYWAYGHDYANSVISVRRGSIIGKREKDWTMRIGNDRHLICIEDPFVTSHDLGRVVDKFSIRVLREEFERAADIMQYDPNPCMTLFEPYVPS